VWERTEALAPQRLLAAILSREALAAIRRVIRRDSSVSVKPDQVVTALRKMLNESAAALLENVEVSLPVGRASRARKDNKKKRLIRLKELVEAGLIAPGTVIFADFRDNRYKGAIDAEGNVLFEGNTYRSLSGAAGAVMAKYDKPAPNGWTFWHVADPSGVQKPLDALREAFCSRRA